MGPRPWIPAILVACAWVGVVVALGPVLPVPALVAYLGMVPLGCALGAIDLACLRLPESLVWPGIGASLLAFAAAAAVTGDWGALGRAAGGGLAYAGAYLVLALLPGGQLGLGDVTLGGLLGLYLGWLGWSVVLLGALLPFLLHAPVALALLVARRAGRSSELPFGPAMMAGAYLVAVVPAGIVALATPG